MDELLVLQCQSIAELLRQGITDGDLVYDGLTVEEASAPSVPRSRVQNAKLIVTTANRWETEELDRSPSWNDTNVVLVALAKTVENDSDDQTRPLKNLLMQTVRYLRRKRESLPDIGSQEVEGFVSKIEVDPVIDEDLLQQVRLYLGVIFLTIEGESE